MNLVLFQKYSPVKWILFEEGNLEVGRSDARVLVGPNILGALKHLVRHRFTRLKNLGQIFTLGGETRVGVGIP